MCACLASWHRGSVSHRRSGGNAGQHSCSLHGSSPQSESVDDSPPTRTPTHNRRLLPNIGLPNPSDTVHNRPVGFSLLPGCVGTVISSSRPTRSFLRRVEEGALPVAALGDGIRSGRVSCEAR